MIDKKSASRLSGLLPRHFYSIFGLVIAQFLVPSLLMPVCSASPDDGDSIDIAIKFSRSKQCKIVSTIEHDGHVLLLSDEENPETKPLPLRVKGKLDYFQRMTSETQAIRYFQHSLAKIRLQKGNTNPTLADESRLIVARSKPTKGGRVEMASIRNMLTQEELELLQSPADPLCLTEFLSRDGLAIGDSWKPSARSLARFLNVDRVVSSGLKLKLKSVNRDRARIFFGGNVDADVFDVTTQIDVHGLAIVDLKSGQIRSLKVSLQEDRPAGQIEPGYKGDTRIDTVFDFSKQTEQLGNKQLSVLAKSQKIQQRLKYKSEAGAFQIVFEPRWKLIAGEADSAIMRFVDNGNVVTQCNVVLLPARPANQPLQLSTFEKEIAKAIDADKQAQVVTSATGRTDNGLASLSVMVEGEENGVPVNWFYYHLSAKDGRQITFVFTLAKSVAVRAKGVADQLVDEFQFLQKPVQRSTARKGNPSRKTNR